jgi:hypothetical protein
MVIAHRDADGEIGEIASYILYSDGLQCKDYCYTIYSLTSPKSKTAPYRLLMLSMQAGHNY